MANSLIEQIESSPLRPGEQLELAYRKARNAHLSGQLKEASGYYEQVINNNQKLTATYFVPNSFLQIAYIKLTQRDTSEAIIYFNKVLEFKRHPYKNSLDSKAKIALETINFAGG
jgi:tetratricopeptide (TPR) repeat protein